jgi:uncharacterized protein YnzC (UPF0291/DUF896 family)
MPMMKENHILEFDRYYLHELTEQEVLTFELRLEQDHEFKNEFDKYLQTIAIVEGAGRQSLREKLKKIHQEQYGSSTFGKFFIHRRLWLAAASVLVIASISLYFYFDASLDTSGMYNEYAEVYPAPSAVRSADTAKTNHWNKFVQLYENFNYTDAEMVLHELEPDSTHPLYMIQFYEGLCITYQNSTRDTDAIQLFQSVLQNENPFYEQALWFSALISLRNGDVPKATVQLEELYERRGYKWEVAGELLDRLR